MDGARISVRGTIITAVTRADGTYSIGVPVGTIELVVIRIGYTRANVTVLAGQSTVDVVLEGDVFRLEEIVVTGRGTGIERRNLLKALGAELELSNLGPAAVEPLLSVQKKVDPIYDGFKYFQDKGNLEIMIEVSNPILEGAFYPWQDSKRRIF